MKKLLVLLMILALFGCSHIPGIEDAGGPPMPPSPWKVSGGVVSPTNSAWSVAIGSPVAAINVAKEVWAVRDSNDDIIATQKVECTNITDGAQACEINTYIMVAGTLTLVQTLEP
jgi:hypothetical protein